MPFFKFRRGDAASAPSAGLTPAQSVEVLRKRAKQRLIGASVLVLMGVVGFPLVFDTQPRPVEGDIPIEIPGKNALKPLVIPASPAPAVASPRAAPAIASEKVAAAASLSPREEIFSSKPAPAPTESAPPAIKKEAKPEPRAAVKTEVKPEPKPEPKPAPKPEPKHEPKPEPKPAPKPEPKPEPKPAPKPEVKVEAKAEVKPVAKPPVKAETSPAPKNNAANDDGVRAIALLNGTQAPKAAAVAKPAATEETKAAAAETKGRMVVQVGAFADASKADETRRRLEGAGLKTYTQAVDTKDGKRIRVRVGPFASKSEAEKAVNKIRSLDLPVAILSF